MASKSKKGKKKNVKNTFTPPKEPGNSSKNFSSYFTSEDIAGIKSVLKIRDLNSIPWVIGSIIANKIDKLKKLIKQGCNVNEIGPNNTSPLTWSVKYKNLSIIEYLISKGADANIKTENGDNILMIALENKDWKEEDFIKLHNIIKTSTKIDVNHTNKNGHNLLHISVRRDWENYIKLLIKEKVNVNIANPNGVTPLMLACYKNNIRIVTLLIKSGAEVIKEDNHNRMALCYAISTEVKKNKPPFLLVETVLKELQKYMPLEEYIQKVIEVIISTSEKPEFSFATSEMMVTIIQYIVQYVQFGSNILVDFNIFDEIYKIISKHIRNQELLKFLLTITFEIISYNEDQLVYESFDQSGLPHIFLNILNNENDRCNNHLAFFSLVLLSSHNKVWLNENFDAFFHYSSIYTLENSREIIDDNKLQMIKNKLKNIKLYTPPQRDQDDDTEISHFSSKKTKRRKKAMKAKIAKIKTLELVNRFNLTGKRIQEPRVYEERQKNLKKSIDVINFKYANLCKEFKSLNKDNYSSMEQGENFHFIKEEENPIVHSILQYLQTEKSYYFPWKEMQPRWANTVYNMQFDRPPLMRTLLGINQEKLLNANKKLKRASLENLIDDEVVDSVDVVVEYLREVLQVIVLKYQHNWKNDKKLNAQDKGDQKQPKNYQKKLEEQEALEKQTLEDLQSKFDELIVSIKDLATKDVEECYKNLCLLEEKLLMYKVRGRKIMFDLCSSENVNIRYSYDNSNYQCDDGGPLMSYIEDVLNDRPINTSLKNVKIKVQNFSNDLYNNDTEKDGPSKPGDEEIPENKLGDPFHIYNSVVPVFDSDSDSKQECLNLAAKVFLTKCKREMELAGEIQQGTISRWACRIHSLMIEKGVKKLLGGDVIISQTRQKYPEYIISHGGNFNPVILGLTSNHQPLAVKQLPKDHIICKVMKSLINPLLGLRHKYILHYYACDYEGSDLIWATPLCEFNIAQYVLVLKETAVFNLKPLELVRQFLLGLRFLHVRKDPIVHGNLKPSNIFIDSNGVIKVGEFGTHKALYKTVEASKTSLIWFSSETYEGYKQSSTMDCTLASDIQVSGMLIYFILSYGVHPYGTELIGILKNLEKAILNLPQAMNVLLVDIITWMMLYDPTERPTIQQVLAHCIFWTEERKWRFILTCAGVNLHQNHGMNLRNIDINELHATIENSSRQEQIDGNWIELVRAKFPTICFCAEDTITGLLKFTRYFYDNQNNLFGASYKEFRMFILTVFPGVLLSLYRILDSTNWLKHPVFYEYTEIESILL